MPGARGVETAAGRRMGLCLVSASVHVSAAAEFLREYMGYLDMGDPLQAFIAGRMYERIEELARLAADMDGVTMDRGAGERSPASRPPLPRGASPRFRPRGWTSSAWSAGGARRTSAASRRP